MANGNITQWTGCIQQAIAVWYCVLIQRTINDRSLGHIDIRTVYSTTIAPAVADFTENVKFDSKTGYTASKYTAQVQQSPSVAEVNTSGTGGTSVGDLADNFPLQTTGNVLSTSGRVNTGLIKYTKDEGTAE